MALALARPQWGEPVANSAASGADVVVFGDAGLGEVSMSSGGSMRRAD
jgi:hypothetical protein